MSPILKVALFDPDALINIKTLLKKKEKRKKEKKRDIESNPGTPSIFKSFFFSCAN